MVNRKYIMVRLTRNQHERIRNQAQAKGFKTISSYVRDSLLGRDLAFDEKFNLIYKKIMGHLE
jgi:Arc/MetJ-type ribon-helix-helix transcriptional regulator